MIWTELKRSVQGHHTCTLIIALLCTYTIMIQYIITLIWENDRDRYYATAS